MQLLSNHARYIDLKRGNRERDLEFVDINE